MPGAPLAGGVGDRSRLAPALRFAGQPTDTPVMGRNLDWAVALGAALVVLAAPSAARAKDLRAAGPAKIVSVDGPALVTVKTQQRTLKMRLFGIDAPERDECGYSGAVKALKGLLRPKQTMRYEIIRDGVRSFERDAAGRYFGWISRPGQDSVFNSVAHELLDTEWVTGGDQLGLNEAPPEHVFTEMGAGTPSFPRSAQGLWAACGGHTHLPVSSAVPAHAPAPWNVNADGMLESVGPITFPSTLTPEATLTVAEVAAVAPVELGDVGNGRCHVRVPSLELLLYATSLSARHPCGKADVYGAWATGPGKVATTNGLAAGAPHTSAAMRFPRAVRTGTEGERLELSGFDHEWPWRTTAILDEQGLVLGFEAMIRSRGDDD